MKTITSPLSLVQRMQRIEDEMNLTNVNVFSLLAIRKQYQHLESWENPDWMDKQLDQHENQINLDTYGKDKC